LQNKTAVMRNFSILNAALIGTSIVLVQPYIAVAISQQEVEKIAQQITVQILDPQNPRNSGSGVIIKQAANTYTVITSYHVVSDGTKNLITPDKQSYQVKNVRRLQKLDLAVVEFSSDKKYPVAKIGNSDKIEKKSLVFVAGFPAKTSVTSNVEFRFKEGKVDAKGSERDGYDINYDNRTSGGMSGGAVLNEQGELIAIHGRAITEVSDENPEEKVISGALGTSIYSALRQMVAVGVDVGVKATDVVASSPKADDFYIKGNEKTSNKDYRGAIADYSEAIKINPKYTNAYINRGAARSDLGDKEGAIADYNLALKLNPNDAEIYYNRGIAHYELGDREGAIADYNLALKVNPNYADAYNNRGLARSKLGKKQEAIADYSQAIKINPNLALAYYNRGVIRSDLGDKKSAIIDFSQAIKINPNYADAYINRGSARSLSGDQQGAIADYNQALKINPNYTDAYNNRGVARVLSGDKEGGIRDLLYAAELYKKQGKMADYQKAMDLIKIIRQQG
jgi:tetratricopeptide (TPR) repeat protein